jgi:nucleoside-diphosphate-sugar epimerase
MPMNNKDKQRIVILGAAGFIGYHLARFFHENCDLSIVLIDNFARGVNDAEFKELITFNRIEFKQLDLTQENTFIDLFTINDIVINCAAMNGTQNFYEKPVQVIRNSAISAVYAAEYCSKANVKKYLYFASSESYAGGVTMGYTPVPTAENVPLLIQDVYNPRWSYAASKTLGEVATIANHHQYNLQFIVLRIHNIYGPRMGLKHVIPDLIYKFSSGNMQVHGVSETRAFFYINDLNKILYEFVFNEKITSNLVYNVGSTNEITVLELADIIRKEMNLDSEIEPIDAFLGSVPRRCPDTSLLRSQINYTETDLIVGLRETMAWYKKHRVNIL